MIFLYLMTMLVVVYSSLVVSSHTKFNNKGIGLDLKHRFLLIFLPLFIVYIHARAAKKVFKSDKKKACKIMEISILKYPVMLGSFIELLKENMAECSVFGNSRLVSLKKSKGKLPVQKHKTVIDLKEIISYIRNIKIYEDMLINNLAV
jgi:cytochrome c biogenesis factor